MLSFPNWLYLVTPALHKFIQLHNCFVSLVPKENSIFFCFIQQKENAIWNSSHLTSFGRTCRWEAVQMCKMNFFADSSSPRGPVLLWNFWMPLVRVGISACSITEPRSVHSPHFLSNVFILLFAREAVSSIRSLCKVTSQLDISFVGLVIINAIFLYRATLAQMCWSASRSLTRKWKNFRTKPKILATNMRTRWRTRRIGF